jgi:hypothetical protein
MWFEMFALVCGLAQPASEIEIRTMTNNNCFMSWTQARLSSKGKTALIFRPINNLEHHPAFKHFGFEISGVFFFHAGVSRSRNRLSMS